MIVIFELIAQATSGKRSSIRVLALEPSTPRDFEDEWRGAFDFVCAFAALMLAQGADGRNRSRLLVVRNLVGTKRKIGMIVSMARGGAHGAFRRRLRLRRSWLIIQIPV